MSELLKKREYYELAGTQTLLALCRTDVVKARVRLATDRELTEDQRAALWHLVDSREWFIKMVSEDYKSQLEQIDRELEAELSR